MSDDRAEDKRLPGFDEVDDGGRADGFQVFEEGTGVAAVGCGSQGGECVREECKREKEENAGRTIWRVDAFGGEVV